VTELLVTEVTLADAGAERTFASLKEPAALPDGCLRIERARTPRPHTYVILSWWTDTAPRKAFESSGEIWPGAEVSGVRRAERTAFTMAGQSTIRGYCAEDDELVPVTVRPGGETCSYCGAALPGRPDARVLPAPTPAPPIGAASDLTGVDLDAPHAASLAAYFRAWNTTDPASRGPLLDAAITDSARYQDPATPEPVAGRAAIEAFMDAMHARFRGVRFEMTHAYGRGERITAEWRMILPTPKGEAVTPGADVLEMHPDGRIQRVIAYFDRGPALWALANRAF
jgi:ketosteroid isomerase-like protein